MGSLTVADITSRVQRQFGDEDFAQIVQADVIRWINDAMREIAQQNDLLQKTGTADSVASQPQYSVPTDILRLRTVSYKGFTLQQITLEDANIWLIGNSETVAQGYPVGTPSTYWVWANKINLYPAPDSSVVGALTIYYTKQPTPVASTGDTPELPAQYDNRIVEYCIAQAFELDMNTTMMQVKNNQFQTGLDKLKGQADWESQEYYPSITQTEEYPADYADGWF